MMWVATSSVPGTQMIAMNAEGSFTGKPEPFLDKENGFGRIGPLVALDDNTALVGTVNKTAGGAPVSSDDRVVIVVRDSSSGGSKD